MEIVLYFFLLLSSSLLLFSQKIKNVIFIVMGMFLNILFAILIQHKYFLLPFFLIISSIVTGAIYIFSANAYHFKNSFTNRPMAPLLASGGLVIGPMGFFLEFFYFSSFNSLDKILTPENFFLKNEKMIVLWILCLGLILQAAILAIFRDRND